MASNVKETIEKVIEGFNSRNLNELGSFLDKNIVYNESFFESPLRGIDAVKQDWQEFFAMIPDVQLAITSIVAEENKAAFEIKYAGTQTGPISGRNTPPTNRCIEMTCAIFVETNANGLIEQWREYYDTGSFYKQLGLTPQLIAE